MEQLDVLTRRLNKRRDGAGERITKNTLLRAAFDLLLERQGDISGATEAEILASLHRLTDSRAGARRPARDCRSAPTDDDPRPFGRGSRRFAGQLRAEGSGNTWGVGRLSAGLSCWTVSWPSAASLRIKDALRPPPVRRSQVRLFPHRPRHASLTRSLAVGTRGAISGRQRSSRPADTDTEKGHTMARTKKSPEQRKAEAEALHAQLAEQVEALASSDAWERFLTFATSFHTYSLNNVLLILAQRPDASHVAGFRQWQAKGRQVRKGEKGIKILGYSSKKVTVEDDNGDETERKVARFPILTVFDIGQTDPIEGAAQVDDLTAHVEGDDVAGIAAKITDWLTGQGWTVDLEPIEGAANGYTTTDGTKRVVIDANLGPAQAAKTTLHDPLTALPTRDQVVLAE